MNKVYQMHYLTVTTLMLMNLFVCNAQGILFVECVASVQMEDK